MKMATCFLAGLLVLACITTSVFPAETVVLFDGSHVGDWDTARDPARLSTEFSRSDLAALIDPPALRWRFTPREARFNDLFLRKPVNRPFTAVRVRLRNQGDTFVLAAKVGDARGAEWTAGRMELQRGNDWRWIEFPANQWKPAPWSTVSSRQMAFPLSYFTLIGFEIHPGKAYEVQVSRVEVVQPELPVAVLHDLSLAKELNHGQSYQARLRVHLDKPCTADGAWLVFLRGQSEAFRKPVPLPLPLSRWKPGETWEETFPVSIPEYAPGGACNVVLELGEAKVLWNGHRMNESPYGVRIKARTPGKTTAAVRNHNGAPTLFINGTPHNGMAYAAYGPSVPVFRDFARAGVNLFSFSATPTEAGYGLSKTTWTAPGQYDFSQLDQRVMMVLEANPQAYFFPRLYLHAPKWWSRQHPQDLVLMDPGDGKPAPFSHAGEKPAPSWTSPAWRQDTIEGLRRLIAHIESSPFADRCIGYHIASGTTEEWMMWGANEDQWVDYSPVNQVAFCQWLRQHYGTPERLRQAWGTETVSFDTAAIPSKVRRLHTDLGSLRDPSREQPVIDFYLFNSTLVADTICHFGRAIKEMTQGKKLVGAFYGYTLQLCGEQRQQNAGHLALEKVLGSPDVDFLCSPTSYAFRQVGGEGTSHFMSLVDSVRLHGKLWFDENDIRTSLCPGGLGEWGKPANVTGDILHGQVLIGLELHYTASGSVTMRPFANSAA